MKLVGQSSLVTKLNNYTLQTLPKTLLFLGEQGCGKHYLASYVSQLFNIKLHIITPEVTADDLIEFSQNPLTTLYLIDLNNFTEKQQNQFLKFIEEPTSTVYIILITKSESGILPTILNRCIKYYFEPYTPEQLKEISGNNEAANSIIYQICNTPGKLFNNSLSSIKDAYNLCMTLTEKLSQASWANTLKISTMINYKEDYNKIDFNLFFDTLEFVSFNYYKANNTKLSWIIYNITNKAKQIMIDKIIVKENFMLNFLTKLWKETH